MTSLHTRDGERLSVRPFTEADLPGLLALEGQVQAFPWRRSHFADCLRGRQRGFLVREGERLVGYCVLTHGGGDAELLNLAVHPDDWGRGIGSGLVELACQTAAEHADLLFLEVRESNTRAIELYEQAGFCETGRRPGYYPAERGREDALILVCPLEGRG